MSDAPETVDARRLLQEAKGGESSKLQAEVNATHTLTNGSYIKQLNQSLADQEKADPTLPKIHFSADGSLVVPKALSPGEYGPPGETTYKPQDADGTDTKPTHTVMIGASNTRVSLNDKGEPVAYSDGRTQVYLDKDGIWKHADMDDKANAQDLGTVAPVLDPNTGELKMPENSPYCYANNGMLFNGVSLQQQQWRRDAFGGEVGILATMYLIDNIGGPLAGLSQSPELPQPGS